MKTKQIHIIFFVSILLNSCSIFYKVPKDIKSRFAYCYDGQNTGIDTLINTDGYYSMGCITDRWGYLGKYEHIIDTVFVNLMFYKNGIFIYNFDDYNHNIPQYFKNIVEYTKNGNDIPFFQRFYWGLYIISGDTIITQYVNHPSPLSLTWLARENRYKIIDSNTIQYIYSKILDRKTEEERKIFQKSMEQSLSDYLPASFIPVEVKPSSDCWLKKEKWFWCDEIKYEEYMMNQLNIKEK